MTVAELIELLENMPEDAEVRLAEQPHWPFEYAISDVVNPADEDPVTPCCDAPYGGDPDENGTQHLCSECGEEADEPTVANVVYIVEGSQLDYLGGAASRAIGWRP